jgi:hypothetical protein
MIRDVGCNVKNVDDNRLQKFLLCNLLIEVSSGSLRAVYIFHEIHLRFEPEGKRS